MPAIVLRRNGQTGPKKRIGGPASGAPDVQRILSDYSTNLAPHDLHSFASPSSSRTALQLGQAFNSLDPQRGQAIIAVSNV
jgi:hypothetical protein